jgi:hypothetical protein
MNKSQNLFLIIILFRRTILSLEYLIQRRIPLECRRIPKRSSKSIPQSEELSVIKVVEEMMVCVMRGAVDNPFKQIRNPVVAIVDRNSPEIDHYKHPKVNVLIHGEQERVQVVRTTLEESVPNFEIKLN